MQSYTTGADDFFRINDARVCAQTFTASTNCDLTSFKASVFREGTLTNVAIDLYATSAGAPTGASLGSAIVDASALTTDTGGIYLEWTFSTPIALTNGTMYAIKMSASTTTTPNRICWKVDGSSPTFANGTTVDSTDAGANWSVYTGYDFLFEIYGTPHWTYTQNFDALTTADLNGQDSWSADTAFDVQSSVVLQGTKSIACTPAGSNRIASRAITATTEGGVSFKWRVTDATEGNGWFHLTSSTTVACQVLWDGGTLKAYNGATLSSLGAYSANTTYEVGIVFDCSTDKYNVYLDGTKVANQFDFKNAVTSIDGILIYSQAGAAGTIYFDDIKVYPPVTIFKDNFTGSTINTAIWNETDPDGVISQNNVLNVDCEASTNRNFFYNKLQSVANVTSGVVCVQGNLTWTTDSANEPQAGIFMYVDDNNYAAITTRSAPGGKYRCVINTGGGGFEYSVEPDVVKGKDVKITYDIGATSIKFWYWNGSAWVQMGTTQTYNIGSTVYYCISGVIGTTPAEGVDPLTVDDAYFFTTDTSDHYPPDTAVTFTISDTTTLTDSFLASLDAKLTDTLTLVESVLMSRGIPFTVEDYITALDSIKLDMGLTVQDIVSMSDEQLLRLMWESITRITGTTWTDRTEPTTNWTSITRQ